MLIYATMLDDELMLYINGVGFAFNALYLLFYLWYSQDRVNEVFKPLAVGIAVIASMFGYTKYEDTQLINWRYGLIATCIMILLLSLPLLQMVT